MSRRVRFRKKWGIPECARDDFDLLCIIDGQRLALLEEIFAPGRSVKDVLWACDVDGMEPEIVMAAVHSGNLQVATLLISALHSAGMDVHETRDIDGDSPVVLAARNGSKGIADFLMSLSPPASQQRKAKAIIERIEERDIGSEAYQDFFLSCCRDGNALEVKRACELGIDVNVCDEVGTPALHLASAGQHPQIIDSLLVAGADLESIDALKRTPLMSACYLFPKHLHEKAHSIVSQLLKNGAKVDAGDKLQTTPLMLAVEVGDHRSAAALLAAEAKIGRKDKFGNTAVHYLGGRKFGDHRPTEFSVETAKILDDAGADLYAVNKTGSTAFMHGTKYIRRLAEYKNKLKNTGLLDPRVDEFLKAAKAGDETSVSELLQQGADPNKHDSLGECFEVTPLHLATLSGHVAIVAELLKAHADTEILGGYSAQIKAWFFRPLAAAAAKGHLRVVNMLVHAGASLEALSRNVILERQTALMFAIERGHFEIVEFLVQAGAQVNAPASTSSDPIHSPLRLAQHKKYKKIADFLEEHGATATVYRK